MQRAELNRLDTIHKVTVLRLRVEFRRSDLQQLDGRTVFGIGVTNGWVSKSTVQSVKAFHKVDIEERYAKAYLPEEPKIPAFYFIKEGDAWKLALWKTFEIANSAFDQMRRQSGLPEQKFLIEMLKRISKYTVDEKIFDGPID